MSAVSAALFNASLAASASTFTPQFVDQDPWTNEPGIVIIDHIRGGFTSEVSSADGEHSLVRLSPHLRALEVTTASQPTLSLDVFEEIISQLHAHQRSKSVRVDCPVENVNEIRRLTGLSWNQLAHLLEVDRRSIYNWLQGGIVRDRNADRIAKLLSSIRYIDEGSIEENQEKLFDVYDGDLSIYELLHQARFDDRHMMSQFGKGRKTASWAPQDRSFVRDYGLSISEGISEIDDESTSIQSGLSTNSTSFHSKKRKARKV
ncbi:MAG: helix-turn-helix transcriptional regulator [Pseudomonadota bacterium]